MPKKRSKKAKHLQATHEISFVPLSVKVAGAEYEYTAPVMVEKKDADDSVYLQDVLCRESTDLDCEELKAPTQKAIKAAGQSFLTR